MKVFGMELDLTVDKKGLDKGLNEARDDLDGFAKRIKDKTGVELSVKAAKLQRQMDKVNEELKKAKKENDEDSIISLTADKNILSNQLTGAKRELRNYARTGEKEVSVLGKNFQSVNNTIEEQGNILGGQINSFGDLKGAMVGAFSSGAGALASFAVLLKTLLGPLIAVVGAIFSVDALRKYGTELESVSANIQKATGAQGELLDSLKDTAIVLNGDVPNGLEEISLAIGEVNTRFGHTGNVLRKTTEDFLNFARVTGFEVKESIRSTSQIMNIFGIEAEQTGNLLDIITVAGQKSGISMDILFNALRINGEAVQQMGFSLGESVALIANFELAGINAEQMLENLNGKLAENAVNGESMGDAFERITKEVANAETETEAIDIAMQGLSTTYGVKIAQAIRNGTLNIEEMVEILKESEGALDDVSEGSLTLGQKLGMVTNDIKAIFAPAVLSIIDVIGTFIEKTKEGMIMSFRLMGTSLHAFGTFFTSTFNALGSFFAAVMNKILNIFGLSLDDMGGALKLVQGIFVVFFNRISIGFKSLALAAELLGLVITEVFKAAKDNAQTIFTSLVEIGDIAFNSIGSIAKGIGNDIVNGFKNMANQVSRIFAEMANNVIVGPLNWLGKQSAKLTGTADTFTGLTGFSGGGNLFNVGSMGQGRQASLDAAIEIGSVGRGMVDDMSARMGQALSNISNSGAVDSYIDDVMSILNQEDMDINKIAMGKVKFEKEDVSDINALFDSLQNDLSSASGGAGGASGGGGGGGGGGPEDATKAEIERLTELAKARIEDVEATEMSEEKKAQAILAINDQLQKDIKKAQSSELQITVDNAKDIVEAREKAEKEKTKIAKEEIIKQRDLEIQQVQDSNNTEEEKAQKIVDINEKAKKELEELDKTSAKKQIEIAENVLEQVQKKQEQASKDIQEYYGAVNDSIEDSIDKVVDYQEEIAKTQEEYEDLKNTAIENIKEIDDELSEIQNDATSTLADRNLSILEEEKNLLKELETIKATEAEDEKKIAEQKEKVLELEKQLSTLQEERQLIQQNVSDEVLQEAQRRDELSETERVLEDLERQKAILAERKSINEAILNGEEILLEEIQNKKNLELAMQMTQQREMLNNKIAVLEEQRDAEIAILEDIDEQRRLIEEEYTKFFDKEIEAREKRLNSLIAKQRQANISVIDSGADGSSTQNNVFNTNVNNEVDAESFLRDISERL